MLKFLFSRVLQNGIMLTGRLAKRGCIIMTGKQKKIGLGLIAALVCCVAFYFLYWVKTPTYSLKIIGEAAQKHDVATFERHVDLDTLYTKAFDDFIVAADKIEGEGTLSNPIAAALLQALKPAVVASLKADTLEEIKGEKADENGKKNIAAQNMTARMKKRTGLERANFKGASVISSEGDTAIVALKVHNQKVDRDFALNVKMTKLDDGKWRLKEMTNLVDFVLSQHKAELEKLAEMDKPIKEQIYKVVSIEGVRGSVWSEGYVYPLWYADANVDLKNTSDKDINFVKGYVEIRDKKGQVVKASDLLTSGPMKANSVGALSTKMHINVFFDKEKALTTTPAREFNMAAEIMEVHFADGTSIIRPTSLPEPKEKK